MQDNASAKSVGQVAEHQSWDSDWRNHSHLPFGPDITNQEGMVYSYDSQENPKHWEGYQWNKGQGTRAKEQAQDQDNKTDY